MSQEESLYFPIENHRHAYLTGEPIETPYGLVKFLKLNDTLRFQQEVNMLSLNVLHYYYLYYRSLENSKDKQLLDELELIKEMSLYEFIMQGVNISEGITNQFFDAYLKIFSLVLDDHEKLAEILLDEYSFMDFRNIICDMNLIQESRVSKNPEIQKALDDQRKMKQLDGGTTTMEDIVSSIAVKVGYTYEQINQLTTYQVYMTYYRIAQMINYDTNTLFATVAEKVTIENWSKNIDMFKKEVEGIKSSDFNQKFGGIFS